jgi:tetratricopeptide (TPR) repeat protein
MIIYASWAWLTILAGRLDDGEKLADRALDLFPQLPPAHIIRGLAHEIRGEFENARACYTRSLELETSAAALGSLAHLYASSGKTDLARQAIEQIRELHQSGQIAYMPAFWEAMFYAGLGKKDQCFRALDRALEQRSDWLIHLGLDPRWAPVRGDKRFVKIMQLVGIPTQCRKLANCGTIG